MIEKHTHIISATIITLLFITVVQWKSDLIKDPPSTLGTISSFATAYGIIFAIIELKRTKNASQHASEEVQRALHAVTGLISAREIIECQSVINLAISTLDEGKPIASITLCQIVRLYSQVFHEQLKDQNSDYRKNRSIIAAYAYNPNTNKLNASTKKTKQALFAITSHLAEIQGATNNFTEYKK
ncbi:hypothetical protein [Tolumonas lignilytica]|uniref:hypothetical protein n=1 Tax=Tolumonas lignilytica TaxID=1283284 RepID=UPI000465C75D|nr:hypothetical protein [Tolumonas lignilytica]